MPQLRMIESFLKALTDDLSYEKGMMYLDLTRDMSWLGGYGLPAHAAWIAICMSRYQRQGPVIDTGLTFEIANDRNGFTIVKHFMPDQVHSDDIKQVCETFENDIMAVCDVLQMTIVSGLIHVAGISTVKFDPTNN